jgi:hypothetical protein
MDMTETKCGCDETNDCHFLLYSIMMIVLQDIKILYSEKFPDYVMTLCSRFSTPTAKFVKVFL